ncbi:dipeptide ABC transporter ATP-binding protein [Curtobacterium ammoniigenes]|uniref:dipeptide ABC transporter ATP-binding protein n=1 Tax=Curtobacterium ammoniigenes TaxID=395387 RepID=UPI000834959E|nr:ABC transporter ATP-binding protein [Curtobacterium ammoniigenes]
MATSKSVLSIDGLTVGFQTDTGLVEAVRGATLSVAAGETLALVGESGSGKSTVALAALGLLGSTAVLGGSVSLAGEAMLGLDDRQLAALRGNVVSMVFQEPATALDPLMRIGDQIAEVIRNHSDTSVADARARAVELLGHVGLPDPEARIRSFPFQLSGGQRQRVVIAMAIANRPKLLVADEPTTALDVTVQAEILDLLRRLATENDMAVLLVTHNMGVVADFADRVAVMNAGEIVESGPVDEVLLRPQHDYTRTLLAAVPRLSISERPLAPASPAEASSGEGLAREHAVGEQTLASRQDLAVTASGVDVTFGRGTRAVRALQQVDLDVANGETVGLVGESGSGKSTIARVVLGLITPGSGEVRVFGEDVHRTRGRALRRLRAGIGVVLQDPVASLDARLSVAECVAEPLLVQEKGVGRAERRRRVAAALEAVRLPAAVMDRAPRELSGGQRQRVSLARALVLNPRLLVADEPTSALDVSVQRTVLEVIAELQQELGFACIFVSHDLAVVQEFAGRVVVMRNGRVVETGPTAVTLSHPDTDYTRRLLAAVPVPDPVVQRARREQATAVTA